MTFLAILACGVAANVLVAGSFSLLALMTE